MTLIMWAMWLGAIPLSRAGGNSIVANFRDFAPFIPKFNPSLLIRYKAAKCGALHNAIEEWNKTLNILAHQRIADEEWVFSRLLQLLASL